MTIPVWLAAVLAAAIVAQLIGAVAWAVRSDQRWALLAQEVAHLIKSMEATNLSVLAQRVDVIERVTLPKLEHEVEYQHTEHKRLVEVLRVEVRDAVTLAREHPSVIQRRE